MFTEPILEQSPRDQCAVCGSPLHNPHGSICHAGDSMASSLLGSTLAKHFSMSDPGCAPLQREKITLKRPCFLVLKPALDLSPAPTWTHSLINSNKITSPSGINNDIGQPIHFGKYTLSHPFLHLTTHLPPLPGITSVESSSYSFSIPQSSLAVPSLHSLQGSSNSKPAQGRGSGPSPSPCAAAWISPCVPLPGQPCQQRQLLA